MVINRNSWHYKFWSFTHAGMRPNYTNLCSYCQRIFWYGILALAVASVMLGFVFILAKLIFWDCLYLHTEPTLIIGGIIICIMALTYMYGRWQDSRKVTPPGLVKQWIAAKKSRVCPLIEFRDDDSDSVMGGEEQE